MTRPPERVTFESILILKPCRLGDVVLAAPVIGAVRRAHPQAQIDFVTGAWSRSAVAERPQYELTPSQFYPSAEDQAAIEKVRSVNL